MKRHDADQISHTSLILESKLTQPCLVLFCVAEYFTPNFQIFEVKEQKLLGVVGGCGNESQRDC